MKSIIFDSGPIISLTLNHILWSLEHLKKQYKGEFYIPGAAKIELVDRPLRTKRFELEALQTLEYIKKGVIKVTEDKRIEQLADEISKLANNIFFIKTNPLKIVHGGEIEALAAYIIKKAEAFVVDERTTRLLIEDPDQLKNILSHKLHAKISIDNNNLKKLRQKIKHIRVIRSIELVTISYKLGLFNKYLPKMPNAKKILLDAVLWGVKLDGCSVSKKEINQIIKTET